MSEFDVSCMIGENLKAEKLLTTNRNLEQNLIWLYDRLWHEVLIANTGHFLNYVIIG